MKITFILPSLKAGGAERVVSFLAQNLNKEKYIVNLIIIGFEKDNFFNVSNVNVTYLNYNRLLTALPKLFLMILKYKPNIVFTSIGHLNLAMGFYSIFFRKTKFITREASVVSNMIQFAKKKQLPFFIQKILYSNIDAVICQSNDMKEDFLNKYHIPLNKCFVISNPITFSKVVDSHIFLKKKNSIPQFITIGRLSEEKGHIRILESLKTLNLDFNYIIIGAGNLKSKILQKIYDFELGSKVTLIDSTNEIQRYLESSDLFLQGSYVEGFPNALLEAASLGIPCIAFEAPGGTKEILTNDLNGYIVNSNNEYTIAIKKALEKKWDINNNIKRIYSLFNSNSILLKYEQLFDFILNKTH